MKTTTRLGMLGALALPLLLSASGCNTFKYVDMMVSFDPVMDDSDILSIARCRILVSGADSANFILERCPNHAAADPHVVGPFEFSTFASSGTLTFELEGFNGLNDTPMCQIADGKTPVPVTGATTLTGTLVAAKGKLTGCSGVSPVGDGGP
jgi:hypothetical protein